MAVEFPSELTVTCDECGDAECTADVTEYAGDPPTVGVDQDGLPEGWKKEGSTYYCPDCWAEINEDDEKEE